MYLTAHHVKARDGSTGINAFLGSHARSTPPIDWDRPDISAIADTQPGQLLLQSIELTPGGNSVLSFLDVAAPDGTPNAFIADALRLFEHYVEEGPLPVRWVSRRIALRFGANLGLQRFRLAEYRRLRARALLLLGYTSESRLRQAPTRLAGPIRIVLTREAGGETYQLDQESTIRVMQVRPELRQALRIHVSQETKDDFQAMVGDLPSHIVTSLTGLSEAQLARLGGIEISEHGRVLWRLGGTAAEGYLHAVLPRQVFGVWTRAGGPLPGPDHAPTGAVLPRLDASLDSSSFLALDLVQVEDVWLPLSEAGVHTYVHSSGLMESEHWLFVTKPLPGHGVRVFSATYDERLLDSREIEPLYGRDAADRARTDRKTIQLRLNRVQS